jgi:hypothetical protein
MMNFLFAFKIKLTKIKILMSYREAQTADKRKNKKKEKKNRKKEKRKERNNLPMYLKQMKAVTKIVVKYFK